MRRAVALLLVIGVSTTALMARQAAPGAATPARPSACALLTKELVTQITPYDTQTLAGVLGVRPTEDPIGQSGSACSYGGITMQIDPFPFATIEKMRTPAWAAVPGVGDAAYFRDNRGVDPVQHRRARESDPAEVEVTRAKSVNHEGHEGHEGKPDKCASDLKTALT